MLDDLPFDVLEKIIEMIPVKSLLQWRSVSKAWKSLIDSAEFIARHSTRHNHIHRLLVRSVIHAYHLPVNYIGYVSYLDDDNFPQQKFELTVPASVALIPHSRMVGSSFGLLCLYGVPHYSKSLVGRSKRNIAVVWNPSIRKHVDIDVPNVLGGEAYDTVLGFGVCPDTSDVKLVKITSGNFPLKTEPLDFIPWQVEVFTLSSRNWRSLCSNIPRKSIKLTWSQVAIDGFIYWFALDRIARDEYDGFQTRNLIMSFDMTTEEFIEVNLPDSLALSYSDLSVSELRGSLVVLDCDYSVEKQICFVWVMNNGVPTSFTKLFTIETPVEPQQQVVGFSKSGKPVMLRGNNEFEDFCIMFELVLYEPGSTNINGVWYEEQHSFFVEPYVETLLLLHVPV